jgi:putative NAD(P)-binding protein
VRRSARIIEQSDLTTILRPAWFTNADEIDYETTQRASRSRAARFRASIAALIVKLAESPELEDRHGLGVSKPE